MKKCLAILTMTMLCAAAAHALPEAPPGEEQAIKDVFESYSQAFSTGKAPAAGPAFTEDAVYVTAGGTRVAGRETIVKRMRDYLATQKGDKMRLTAEKIRFVTPEVAEVDGNVEIRGPGGPPAFGNFAGVLVKQQGRWMIQSLRDLSPSSSDESGTPADHLKNLAWMVGEWSQSEGPSSVRLNCQLNASGTFLMWDYTVKQGGKEVMTVSQRVGWDGQTNSFRSWVFDSVGGFAEGRWDPDANGTWEIRQTGVLPDGSGASATCRLVPINKDSFSFRMTNRRVNGARLADAELRFTRGDK